MSKTGWIILIVCLCLVFCLFNGLFLAKRIAAVLFPDQNGQPQDTMTFTAPQVESNESAYQLLTDWLQRKFGHGL